MNVPAGADAGTSSSGISERIKYQLFPMKDNATVCTREFSV